jgi:hypothetical protein
MLTLTYRRLLEKRTVNVIPYIQKIIRGKKSQCYPLHTTLLEVRTVNVNPYIQKIVREKNSQCYPLHTEDG